MLVPYALVTLGNAKAFLGIQNGAKDEVLEILISACTDMIESLCGRRFASTAYVLEKYDGTGTSELLLKNFPVIVLASIEVRNSLDASGTWETVDTEDYFEEDGILTLAYGKFTRGKENYRISYTAGFDTIPYDLQYLCMKLVGNALNNQAGIKSESLGDHSVTFGDVMEDPTAENIINKYRKIPVL